MDLNFIENSDGDFEADFTFWQQEFFYDLEQEEQGNCTPGLDCTGFSLWGFMDTPSSATNTYTTCDINTGFEENTYDNEFEGGATFIDILNAPTQYIADDDWVAGAGYVWNDVLDVPVLSLDYKVE